MAANAEAVKDALQEHVDLEKAEFYPRFFKAGKGEYAEGDKFLGVTVPNQRKVAKAFRDLPLPQISRLLKSPWHEQRLTALFILVLQFERCNDEPARRKVVDFYLDHLDFVNNWDLVDSSAHKILGTWLLDHEEEQGTLDELAESGDLWRERVSVIACLPLIKQGEFDWILRLSEWFLDHEHDLIHKAVGWMLREAGKQDRTVLRAFLDTHAPVMPRTMLRYAIEKLPAHERRGYLSRS